MKLISKNIVVFLVCFLFPQDLRSEEVLPDAIDVETSISMCWIECPLYIVLNDINNVPGISVHVNPDVNEHFRNTPISLDIIDIDCKQLLDEVLSPIGLTYSHENQVFRVYKKMQGTPVECPIDGYVCLWMRYHNLNGLDGNRKQVSKKRRGHTFVMGKVCDQGGSSDINKFEVIYLWISHRHRLTIAKRYIQNGKTVTDSKATYIFVPVVERTFRSSIEKE